MFGDATRSGGAYSIQSGDTLSGIAQRTGVSVDSLLAANPQISDADTIYAGDTISVPSSGDGSGSFSGSTSTSRNGSDYGDTGGVSVPGSSYGDDDANTYSGGAGTSASKPVLLDLDGDGVELTPLDSSTMYFDMSGDGLQNRTAWAGAGDGVLVRDAGNDGVINEAKEINFTLWDATARSDMEALRNAFDTNRDGVLNAGDRDFDLFKVLVTNDDGTTTLKTLAELGIVSIDLVTNNQRVVMSDGSEITGTSKYTRTDGTTGTAADTRLTYETSGYIVDRQLTGNPDGTNTVVTSAFRADGSLAHVTRSSVDADGLITTAYDDNGDGVDDRMQMIGSSVDADGRVRQRGGNWGVTEAAPFQATAVEIRMVSGLLPVAMSSAIGSVCM